MTEPRFMALTDFTSLRWKRGTMVLVGDGPDARTCNLMFVATIVRCWISWDLIRFDNGKIFWPSVRMIDGKPAYLFTFWPLREVWRRRLLEREVLAWLRDGPIEDARTVAEWVFESAGNPARLWWAERDSLVTRVEEQLPNSGVRDLETVVSIIHSETGEGAKAAA